MVDYSGRRRRISENEGGYRNPVTQQSTNLIVTWRYWELEER